MLQQNLLESMILINPQQEGGKRYFNILELGATGLVLATETAIGNNSINCINYLDKIIKTYKNYTKINL